MSDPYRRAEGRPEGFAMPILISFKTLDEKYMRELHCIWCGRIFSEVSDDIAVISDSYPNLAALTANDVGPTRHRCRSGTCKQSYAMEWAL